MAALCHILHPSPTDPRALSSFLRAPRVRGAWAALDACFDEERRRGTASTPAALPAAGEEAPPAQAASPRRVSAGRARPLHPALPVRALRS